jgi:Uma2 family endonuclease
MSTALKPMTVDEFLSWAEGREGRWELHDGVPVMMSPERALHGRVKFSAAKALDGVVTTAGLPCEVFTGGMAIRIDTRTAYEPDASVVCGPQAPPVAIEIDNPVIVVEVLFQSTAAVDHGRKLSGYFTLASVQHYLILDPERRVVIHHKRGASDAIETRVLSEGSVKLVRGCGRGFVPGAVILERAPRPAPSPCSPAGRRRG